MSENLWTCQRIFGRVRESSCRLLSMDGHRLSSAARFASQPLPCHSSSFSALDAFVIQVAMPLSFKSLYFPFQVLVLIPMFALDAHVDFLDF
eukprot:2543870-Pleurochrysis_carterae.AAC.1